ncbi:hypothetical protein OM076_43840 [Solirubrobacter ginsenosidimutans]|uniref:Uncharacterized protein n=1 Tax=Solirubrobacter ginsenosidimutans TaxID=490573 RepID=A0A9X3N9B8_9ACTN|nr:hypothetical protein [Solirubrobacter ginsenosidimutans]MDA0167273.1 hypothetical protein [Solirubrobacter ginsenosidimutans]
MRSAAGGLIIAVTLGVSRREIEGVGDELEPGQAAGMILVEHVWARDLAEAIESTGGGSSRRACSGPKICRRSSPSSRGPASPSRASSRRDDADARPIDHRRGS